MIIKNSIIVPIIKQHILLSQYSNKLNVDIQQLSSLSVLTAGLPTIERKPSWKRIYVKHTLNFDTLTQITNLLVKYWHVFIYIKQIRTHQCL